MRPVLSTEQRYLSLEKAEQGPKRAFGIHREQILFAAFAAWDAVGAKWFGFPTVWVKRLNSPAEELSVNVRFRCH